MNELAEPDSPFLDLTREFAATPVQLFRAQTDAEADAAIWPARVVGSPWQGGPVGEAREALRAASGIGDYFAVDEEPGDGWRTLADLVADEALLRDRVATARAGLAAGRGVDVAEIEERPAASIWFQGFASRLLSAPFGAAVLAGAVPRLGPDTVHWLPVPTGPVPVAFDDTGCVTGDTEVLARSLHDDVIARAIVPVLDAVAGVFEGSSQVLWGNVASAFAGATIVVRDARPDRAVAALDIAEHLQELPLLAGTGRYATERFFARTSCCLYYRIPDSGLCGDCVLVTSP